MTHCARTKIPRPLDKGGEKVAPLDEGGEGKNRPSASSTPYFTSADFLSSASDRILRIDHVRDLELRGLSRSCSASGLS